MTDTVIVLGAGIIGISTALALQSRGRQVTLIDRQAAARETSYGNAGVIALGSALPLNNPDLFADIPALLGNRDMSLRYSPAYLLKQWHPLLNFLWSGRAGNTPRRAEALHQLLQFSSERHKNWLNESAQTRHLRETGWLKVYRNRQQYEQSTRLRRTMDQHHVHYDVLDGAAIAEHEPHIAPVFSHGLLINDASSVDNPSAVANVYLEMFLDKGGHFVQRAINKASQTVERQWRLSADDGDELHCAQLVIALGPWSRDFLDRLAIRLPMIFERGGHREFQPVPDKPIKRPIYDAGGGFVLTPMSGGLRLTCGVELNEQDAYYKPVQLDHCEKIARNDFPVGDRTGEDWHGSRPTLPDSLPVIGPSQRRGLWFNTGHQHLGFSTAPGSAELLAAQMLGEPTSVDVQAFSPSRFNL
ncbi:MAG: FAD-dependent oxidoreductase [Gammaproteobacteria bacterium]|nr:FAD-dependent oxidoreductase [Gammaproteobacteria bacterium]